MLQTRPQQDEPPPVGYRTPTATPAGGTPSLEGNGHLRHEDVEAEQQLENRSQKVDMETS